MCQVLQRLGIHGNMLAAIQSLYIDSRISININGRVGMPISSKTGVKQGCPLSPTLFGLFADGLHRYLLHCCPNEGPGLQDGKVVPDLGYADGFMLLATTAKGLQRLLDAVANFCTCMGMVTCIQKTEVIAFGHLYPVFFQWLINGEQLEIVFQLINTLVSFLRRMKASPSLGT